MSLPQPAPPASNGVAAATPAPPPVAVGPPSQNPNSSPAAPPSAPRQPHAVVDPHSERPADYVSPFDHLPKRQQATPSSPPPKATHRRNPSLAPSAMVPMSSSPARPSGKGQPHQHQKRQQQQQQHKNSDSDPLIFPQLQFPKEQVLQKMGDDMWHKWKYRFFKLHQAQLYYYKFNSRTKELISRQGSIPLEDATITKYDADRRSPSRGAQFCFGIGVRTRKERTYILRASSEESREEWVNYLLNFVELLKQARREGLLWMKAPGSTKWEQHFFKRERQHSLDYYMGDVNERKRPISFIPLNGTQLGPASLNERNHSFTLRCSNGDVFTLAADSAADCQEWKTWFQSTLASVDEADNTQKTFSSTTGSQTSSSAVVDTLGPDSSRTQEIFNRLVSELTAIQDASPSPQGLPRGLLYNMDEAMSPDIPENLPLTPAAEYLQLQDDELNLTLKGVRRIEKSDWARTALIARLLSLRVVSREHRKGFTKHSDCFQAGEAQAELIRMQACQTPEEAAALCNHLLALGYLTPVGGEPFAVHIRPAAEAAAALSAAAPSPVGRSPGGSSSNHRMLFRFTKLCRFEARHPEDLYLWSLHEARGGRRGWLGLKNKAGRWQAHYAVLSPGKDRSLGLYRNPGSPSRFPAIVIPLNQITTVYRSGEQKSRENILVIVCWDYVWKLRANSEECMADWIRALSTAVLDNSSSSRNSAAQAPADVLPASTSSTGAASGMGGGTMNRRASDAVALPSLDVFHGKLGAAKDREETEASGAEVHISSFEHGFFTHNPPAFADPVLARKFVLSHPDEKAIMRTCVDVLLHPMEEEPLWASVHAKKDPGVSGDGLKRHSLSLSLSQQSQASRPRRSTTYQFSSSSSEDDLVDLQTPPPAAGDAISAPDASGVSSVSPPGTPKSTGAPARSSQKGLQSIQEEEDDADADISNTSSQPSSGTATAPAAAPSSPVAEQEDLEAGQAELADALCAKAAETRTAVAPSPPPGDDPEAVRLPTPPRPVSVSSTAEPEPIPIAVVEAAEEEEKKGKAVTPSPAASEEALASAEAVGDSSSGLASSSPSAAEPVPELAAREQKLLELIKAAQPTEPLPSDAAVYSDRIMLLSYLRSPEFLAAVEENLPDLFLKTRLGLPLIWSIFQRTAHDIPRPPPPPGSKPQVQRVTLESVDAPSKEELAARKKEEIDTLRKRAINNIMMTETMYLEDLDLLVQAIVSPLRNRVKKKRMKGLTMKDFEIIVGNIEAINDFHKHKFTQDITYQYSLEAGRQDFPSVFIHWADHFKMYSDYATNIQQRMELIAKIKATRSFRKFYADQQRVFKRLRDVMDLFIQPIQRIVRYVSFLQKLREYTDKNDKMYAKATTAINRMTVIARILESKRGAFQEQLNLYADDEEKQIQEDAKELARNHWESRWEGSCPLCRKAATRFEEFTTRHFKGSKFQAPIGNSLLGILVTPVNRMYSDATVMTEDVNMWSKPIVNAGAWTSLLACLVGTPLTVRRHFLKNIFSSLVGTQTKATNIVSLAVLRDWRQYIFALTYDLPSLADLGAGGDRDKLLTPEGLAQSSLSSSNPFAQNLTRESLAEMREIHTYTQGIFTEVHFKFLCTETFEDEDTRESRYLEAKLMKLLNNFTIGFERDPIAGATIQLGQGGGSATGSKGGFHFRDMEEVPELSHYPRCFLARCLARGEFGELSPQTQFQTMLLESFFETLQHFYTRAEDEDEDDLALTVGWHSLRALISNVVDNVSSKARHPQFTNLLHADRPVRDMAWLVDMVKHFIFFHEEYEGVLAPSPDHASISGSPTSVLETPQTPLRRLESEPRRRSLVFTSSPLSPEHMDSMMRGSGAGHQRRPSTLVSPAIRRGSPNYNSGNTGFGGYADVEHSVLSVNISLIGSPSTFGSAVGGSHRLERPEYRFLGLHSTSNELCWDILTVDKTLEMMRQMKVYNEAIEMIGQDMGPNEVRALSKRLKDKARSTSKLEFVTRSVVKESNDTSQTHSFEDELDVSVLQQRVPFIADCVSFLSVVESRMWQLDQTQIHGLVLRFFNTERRERVWGNLADWSDQLYDEFYHSTCSSGSPSVSIRRVSTSSSIGGTPSSSAKRFGGTGGAPLLPPSGGSGVLRGGHRSSFSLSYRSARYSISQSSTVGLGSSPSTGDLATVSGQRTESSENADAFSPIPPLAEEPEYPSTPKKAASAPSRTGTPAMPIPITSPQTPKAGEPSAAAPPAAAVPEPSVAPSPPSVPADIPLARLPSQDDAEE